MELRMLRSFLVVAREGGVSRAARTLHITQPALSRQLAELERELGCELLVRGPRGVTLTEEGALLRKRAEQIVELADRAEAEVRAPNAEIEGDVWVGCGESRAVHVVARVAARLGREHPGLRLRLHSGNGADVMERVDKGLLDFGIVMGQDVGPDYDALELGWNDTWGLLLPRDHELAGRASLTPDDLRGLPLIVSSQDGAPLGGPGATVELFERQGCRVVATYTLLYNASLLVECGLGLAVCFDGIIATGPGTSFAYVPLEGLPGVPSRIIWKRHQPLTRAAALFLREMRSEVTQVG